MLRQVRALELRARGLAGSLFTGEARSLFRGQGLEFAEVRPWVDGDDHRAIDWNVSARFGAPYVKTFTPERDLTVLLVVDRSGSTATGEPVTKRDRNAELAAVLALAAAWHGDRVGLIGFTARPELVRPPARGRRAALRAVRDLLAHAPAGRCTRLGAALAHAGRLLGPRSIVVVISDFLAPDWEAPFRELAARHEVVALLVREPREVEVPAAGWIRVEDAESGEQRLLDTAASAVREGAAQAAARHRHAVARACREAGADLLVLRTDEEWATALRRLLLLRRRVQVVG
ncbi:MAG: DUF58 domain-containing protein [Gemmatimonadales bacterium]|nr:DUF58 domain-containing protein [Gemmatimonadales bacterium]